MDRKGGSALRRSGIAGGFVRIEVWKLAAVWTAYSQGVLQVLDVRVWLACLEMAERRRWMGEGKAPDFGLDELRGLVGRGRSARLLRTSLRRLERLGGVRMRRTSLSFARCLEDVKLEDLGPVFDVLKL